MKATKQPIQWPAETIWEQVAPLLPNFTVEVLPEIDSTNTELMRRAKAGQIEPILLVAEKQTAGRGRLGREWHDLSERSGSDSIPTLTFSLGMPLSPVDWSGMSLAVGISIAQSLHPRIGLKWPNDLWVDGQKLAGILIETCSIGAAAQGGARRYVVIGVGINIAQPTMTPSTAAALLRIPATCLQALLETSTAPDALLSIALPLVQTMLTFSRLGFSPFASHFNALDVLRGKQIDVLNKLTEVSTKMPTSTGLALGVNAKGELMLQTTVGLQTINSSEVSISTTKTLPL
jgi:BirA family transcriptional regulator, biotin operon repressor / biotin---[acetyl-CoA-carboxylase] ligase